MGYVVEQPNGKWRARRGRGESATFASRSEAYAWADSDAPKPTKRVTATPASPAATVTAAVTRGTPVTMRQFVDGGGYRMINLKAGSIKSYRSQLNRHILPRWGDVYLTEIRHEDIQDWLDVDIRDGWVLRNGERRQRSRNTIAAITKVIYNVMDAAAKRGLIATNPASQIVMPTKDAKDRRYLTVGELSKLHKALEELEPAHAVFVPLCGFLGLRIGEAFGLRWGCVDLFRGTLKVEKIVDDARKFTDPKTAAGRRTLSIPRQLVTMLADHRRAQGGDTGPDALVFQHTAGRALVASQFRTKYFNPAVESADLGPLVPHELRHTAVALWIAAGATPLEITTRIGHEDVAFTLKTYGHLFPSLDIALNNALADKFDAEW